MRKLLITLFFLFVMGNLHAEDSHKDLCVLIYERESSNVTQSTISILQKVPNSLILTEAKPVDFLRCVEEGYQEILFIAHGFWIRGTEDFQLGYFIRDENSSKLNYKAKLFYNRVFQTALGDLQNEIASSGTTRLKKIRFAACGVEALRNKHPALSQIMELPSIELDLAPSLSPLLAKVAKDTNNIKRAMTKPWIAKSARCELAKEWKAPLLLGTCKSDDHSVCDRQTIPYCIPTKF